LTAAEGGALHPARFNLVEIDGMKYQHGIWPQPDARRSGRSGAGGLDGGISPGGSHRPLFTADTSFSGVRMEIQCVEGCFVGEEEDSGHDV